MSRYSDVEIVSDDSDYYSFLRRGKKFVSFHTTAPMRNPSRVDRMQIDTANHIWTHGDRYYKLANDYYGDVRFWWVIAWWNGAPMEAHLSPGNLIRIPIDIQKALRALGV
tara:strand:- start:165 stop:494 length:330 start_codon:yes stop_codon:yes gene_type:complete